jgi:hypothetical protein
MFTCGGVPCRVRSIIDFKHLGWLEIQLWFVANNRYTSELQLQPMCYIDFNNL